MFIEIAETLDCPVCGDGYGLVAFVLASDRRRVTSGHLGCPMCETEFPIANGTIDFGGGGVAATRDPVVEPDAGTDASGSETRGSDITTKIAALMGLGDRPGRAVLLGPGLGGRAPALARLADAVEVLAVVNASEAADWEIDDLAAGSNPVTGLGARWPIRGGALDGVALVGPVGDAVTEVWRCLSAGRRLVVIDPSAADIGRLTSSGFDALGSDDHTWVGVRR